MKLFLYDLEYMKKKIIKYCETIRVIRLHRHD